MRANNVPPTSHPAYARLSSAAHTANLTLYPDSTVVPIATSPHSHSTTDSNAHIFSLIAGGLPSFNTDQDNEAIVATLPVLSEVLADNDPPHSDFCHYDSGANRQVFNNQGAFKCYHHIQLLMLKGFGHNLTTCAIGQGTVHLHAKCDTQTVTILLTNVLHNPAARSNLVSGIQFDKVGVSALLTNGTARLYLHRQKIADSEIHNEMFRLNVDIVRPVKSRSLLERMANPPPLSRNLALLWPPLQCQALAYITSVGGSILSAWPSSRNLGRKVGKQCHFPNYWFLGTCFKFGLAFGT